MSVLSYFPLSTQWPEVLKEREKKRELDGIARGCVCTNITVIAYSRCLPQLCERCGKTASSFVSLCHRYGHFLDHCFWIVPRKNLPWLPPFLSVKSGLRVFIMSKNNHVYTTFSKYIHFVIYVSFYGLSEIEKQTTLVLNTCYIMYKNILPEFFITAPA